MLIWLLLRRHQAPSAALRPAEPQLHSGVSSRRGTAHNGRKLGIVLLQNQTNNTLAKRKGPRETARSKMDKILSFAQQQWVVQAGVFSHWKHGSVWEISLQSTNKQEPRSVLHSIVNHSWLSVCIFLHCKGILGLPPKQLVLSARFNLEWQDQAQRQTSKQSLFFYSKMWDVRRQLPCNHAPQVSVCGDYWSWGPGPGATKQFAAFRLNPFLLFKQSKAPQTLGIQCSLDGFPPRDPCCRSSLLVQSGGSRCPAYFEIQTWLCFKATSRYVS